MPSTEPRNVAVPKYFRKTPKKISFINTLILGGIGGSFLIVGLFLFIVGVISSKEGFACCIIPFVLIGLGIGGYAAISGLGKRSLYKRKLAVSEPKPTDIQMDSWLSEDINRIKSQALDKLNLLPEQILNDANDPIMIIGPRNRAKIKTGKDSIIRFSAYDVVLIYLTTYHLASYQCQFDMDTGKKTTETTKEYHYNDVVSVATQTINSGFSIIIEGESEEDTEEREIPNHQEFTLAVPGEKIRVVIALPDLADITSDGRLAPTGAEKAISIVRAMLREKKGGSQI